MKTYLIISFYFKGSDFIIECKNQGNKIYLLTSENLKNKPWPKDAIDEIYYMSEEYDPWKPRDILLGVAHLMQETKINQVVALDDFDVEKAALIREEFRIPGMGQTTAKYFRDKLAMRIKAKENSIPIPHFVSLQNNQDITHFLQNSTPPWVIKPRSLASAAGIQKVHSREDFWEKTNAIGNERYMYLAEEFKPGSVYHVDSLIKDGQILYTSVSCYLDTPFEVAHGGGVFRTRTLDEESEDFKSLFHINSEVLQTFGMRHGATHTEFIKNVHTGEFYFLETSSRVGGAHISEMIEYTHGINLWKEWAKIEYATINNSDYSLSIPKKNYGGLLICLSKVKNPDLSIFSDEEVVWKIDKEYHAGIIVVSKNKKRIEELLESYSHSMERNFLATLPPKDKPLD